MITLSIDLKLIDQARCKKMARKNGEPAVFCDLIMIATPNGQYGDYMVKQSVTKEEREAGVQMPILGNAKNRSGTAAPAKRTPTPPLPPELGEDEPLPF